MYSKIFNSIFLISTIISLILSTNTYVAQAGPCGWFCSLWGRKGKITPPTIPAATAAKSEAVINEGRATALDHLIVANYDFKKGQLSEAQKHYLQANEMAAATQDKEIEATAKFGLGKVSSKLGYQNQAINYFTQSGNLYNDIGDTQRAKQVQSQQFEIQRLQRQYFERTPSQLQQKQLRPQLERTPSQLQQK